MPPALRSGAPLAAEHTSQELMDAEERQQEVQHGQAQQDELKMPAGRRVSTSPSNAGGQPVCVDEDSAGVAPSRRVRWW